jgi:hypothetical protein
MDLTQSKLTRSEWETIELPVSDQETEILRLIQQGYQNVNIRFNNTQSLLSHMKMETSPEFHDYLFKQYFAKDVQDMTTTYSNVFGPEGNTGSARTTEKPTKTPTLKTRDLIRLQSMDSKIAAVQDKIFEFVLLSFCRNTLQYFASNSHEKNKKASKSTAASAGPTDYAFYLYTLIRIREAMVASVNPRVLEFVDRVIASTTQALDVRSVLKQAYHFIEKTHFS